MVEHEFFEARRTFPFTGMDAGPSATHLHALLEYSPIATIVLDPQHRYRMCNPAFETLFQFTPTQLASANLDDLISGPETAEEAAQLTCTVLQGTKVHTVTQRRRRDGMMVDVEIYGIPLFESGELTGIYGLYQDVTERNKARMAFLEMSNQFENLKQEERRRFARDLHDSTSQELAVLNWNLTRLLNMVGDRDRAISNLVHATKDIAYQCSARIRSASYLMHPPLLGKGGLTLAVPSMVEGFEQRSGIRVKLEMSLNVGRFRDEVEIAIYRVVQEGLANVLKHSGCGEVMISLYRRKNRLELTVCDSGRGHTREQQLHSYNSRSGVGISGIRERVEELGGSVNIDCHDQGTTLRVEVPLDIGSYGSVKNFDCR